MTSLLTKFLLLLVHKKSKKKKAELSMCDVARSVQHTVLQSNRQRSTVVMAHCPSLSAVVSPLASPPCVAKTSRELLGSEWGWLVWLKF